MKQNTHHTQKLVLTTDAGLFSIDCAYSPSTIFIMPTAQQAF